MSNLEPETTKVTPANPDSAIEAWAPPGAPQSAAACGGALSMAIDLEQKGQGLALRLKGSFAKGEVDYVRKSWFGLKTEQYVILFGIRGGKLTAWLRNAQAPWAGRYKGSIQETETVSAGRSSENSSETGSTAGLEVSGDGPTLKLEGSDKRSRKDGRDSGVEYARATVATTGPDDAPEWQFDSDDHFRHLFGAAPGYEPPLAAVASTGDPVEVLAAFRILPRDLCLIDVQAPFGTRRSRKKLAVVGKTLPTLLAKRAGAIGKKELVIAFARNRLVRPSEPPTVTVRPGEEQ